MSGSFTEIIKMNINGRHSMGVRVKISSLLAYAAIVTTLYGVIDALQKPSHLTKILLLPLLYVFLCTIFDKLYVQNNKYRITLTIILIIQFIRSVFIPVVGVSLGNYDNLFGSSSFNTTINLLIYEQIIVGILCIYIAGGMRHRTHTREHLSYDLRGNSFAYILYAFLALFVFIIWGRNENLLSFIALDTSQRVGDITDFKLVAIRTLITSGITFFSIVIITNSYKRYAVTQKERYVVISIIISMIVLSIIIGERRSNQIYNLFAYSWVLSRLYPSYRKRIIWMLCTIAVLIITLMTIYKSFDAYLYNSYIIALEESRKSIAETIEILDRYFCGLSCINMNIEYFRAHKAPSMQIVIDIFRNIFGVHFLLKDN